MAVPVHFQGADFVLGPPAGEGAAVMVPVRRLDRGRIVSCWLLSIEEIEEIGRYRRIWLEQAIPGTGGLAVPKTFVTAMEDQVLGDAPR
jgi:hypothetical protein